MIGTHITERARGGAIEREQQVTSAIRFERNGAPIEIEHAKLRSHLARTEFQDVFPFSSPRCESWNDQLGRLADSVENQTRLRLKLDDIHASRDQQQRCHRVRPAQQREHRAA